MRNANADVVYRFWRWEYLRRNPDYISSYHDLVEAFRMAGISGFPIRKIGKIDAAEIFNIDLLTLLESMPDDPRLKINILAAWESFSASFHINLPHPPNAGPDAKTVLLEHIEAERTGRLVEYDLWTPGAVVHNFIRFSSMMTSEDDDHLIRRGGHLFTAGTPESLMTKKKIIDTAEQRLLKSRTRKNADHMVDALRNWDRENLRVHGKRIKKKPAPYLLRAVGLYLWDRKQETGVLSLGMIEKFYADFPDLPDRYRLDDLGQELRKIVKKTGMCIKHMGLLPMR